MQIRNICRTYGLVSSMYNSARYFAYARILGMSKHKLAGSNIFSFQYFADDGALPTGSINSTSCFTPVIGKTPPAISQSHLGEMAL